MMTVGIPHNSSLLFTEEGLELIDQACSQVELEAQNSESEPEYPARARSLDFFSSSDRDSTGESDEPDSNSSSDSDDSGPSEEDNVEDEKAKPPIRQESKGPKKRSKGKKNARDHARIQQIRQKSSQLNRLEFPLNQSSSVHIPAALLPREELLGGSQLSRCRAFHGLAKEVGMSGQTRPIIVLLLRSGRFAAGVFSGGRCIQHSTSQRYTIRKGQGKAQSSQDARRRPKSIGSQLRRAGEQSLKEDIHSKLTDWEEYIRHASMIFVSCPKTMKSTLFPDHLEHVFTRRDPRLRSVPFDIGRPSHEAVCVVFEVLMTLQVREKISSQDKQVSEPMPEQPEESDLPPANKLAEQPVDPMIPLTSLHEAARDGNLSQLLDFLSQARDNGVDQRAGYDFMTPLHFAAESASKVDPLTSAACVSALLIQGHADPCTVDARNRVPYFLASHDRVREAFRTSRALLGEDYCDWEAAKVGPPLTDDDIRERKEKEAEKKRRKKAKQKEKKAKAKAQTADLERRRQEEKQKLQEEEDAKRVRDLLLPKSERPENACDFCQTVCKGKKRLQMFTRLDYKYCSSDCVQKHKRELMAAAAMSRFQN